MLISDKLQDELAGTENRIATSRKDYNDAVQGYNTKIKRFPANIYAGIFGFEAREIFRAQPGAQTVPNVSFNLARPTCRYSLDQSQPCPMSCF